jgi:hypothetical protein
MVSSAMSSRIYFERTGYCVTAADYSCQVSNDSSVQSTFTSDLTSRLVPISAVISALIAIGISYLASRVVFKEAAEIIARKIFASKTRIKGNQLMFIEEGESVKTCVRLLLKLEQQKSYPSVGPISGDNAESSLEDTLDGSDSESGEDNEEARSGPPIKVYRPGSKLSDKTFAVCVSGKFLMKLGYVMFQAEEKWGDQDFNDQLDIHGPVEVDEKHVDLFVDHLTRPSKDSPSKDKHKVEALDDVQSPESKAIKSILWHLHNGRAYLLRKSRGSFWTVFDDFQFTVGKSMNRTSKERKFQASISFKESLKLW